MTEPLEQRVIERKIYEEVVNLIVDSVYKEFPHDVEARLRIYDLIADNFSGMVRSLRVPDRPMLLEEIENGDKL